MLIMSWVNWWWRYGPVLSWTRSCCEDKRTNECKSKCKKTSVKNERKICDWRKESEMQREREREWVNKTYGSGTGIGSGRIFFFFNSMIYGSISCNIFIFFFILSLLILPSAVSTVSERSISRTKSAKVVDNMRRNEERWFIVWKVTIPLKHSERQWQMMNWSRPM